MELHIDPSFLQCKSTEVFLVKVPALEKHLSFGHKSPSRCSYSALLTVPAGLILPLLSSHVVFQISGKICPRR